MRAGRALHASVLYPTHKPTFAWQKLLLTAGSAIAALRNPERGDMVATLGETTGSFALRNMYEQMQNDPVGRQVLAERPRVTSETVPVLTLREFPEGTLGRAYAEYMAAHSFDSDKRTPVMFVDDAELAYVMQRYREVLMRVVCGGAVPCCAVLCKAAKHGTVQHRTTQHSMA